jgi:hypothetical protein
MLNGLGSAPYCRRVHCKEDPIYDYQQMKLRDIVPNFHIHVSGKDLYIPTISPPPPIFCSKIGGPIVGIYKIAHRYINVDFGNETVQLHFWEYLFPVFGTVSLQCVRAFSLTLVLCKKCTIGLLLNWCRKDRYIMVKS